MNTTRTDIIVVGAGLIGLPMAIALAGAGFRTVLIDRADFATPSTDWRTTAIADGSRRILEQIGVWAAMAPQAQPIRDIRVADTGSRLFLHYDHRAVGEAPLGWIVENRAMRAVLAETAATMPALTVLAPAAVAAVERGRQGASVTLADGRVIAADLLIAADGKQSALREAAKIPTVSLQYPQQSLIATVEHARPHHGVAVEHFLPEGPLAILPLQGNRSSIVWTQSPARATALQAMAPAEFDRELAVPFGDWLGDIASVGPRLTYDLDLLLARRLTANRLALIGDAAHVIHPIAGQGWNLGLRDVAVLSEILVEQARLGLDPGSGAVLGRYAARRRPDILALVGATDGVNRLFSNDIPPLRLARRLGLGAVELLPPLKRFFMLHAMGLAGEVPRLAQGQPV